MATISLNKHTFQNVASFVIDHTFEDDHEIVGTETLVLSPEEALLLLQVMEKNKEDIYKACGLDIPSSPEG